MENYIIKTLKCSRLNKDFMRKNADYTGNIPNLEVVVKYEAQSCNYQRNSV